MIMKQYDSILFDWDGCMAKTLDIWLDAYRKTFVEYDVLLEDRVITQQVFGKWDGPTKFGITDIDEYNKKLFTRLNEQYPTVALYANVKQVIFKLKQDNKKLALVTTTDKKTIMPALHYNEIDQYFDIILTAEDVSKHKPDPEIVLKAIDMLDCKKESSIIIGDSKSDLGAAKSASIDSILYYPRHNELFYDLDTLKTYEPTYVIRDFAEIIELVG